MTHLSREELRLWAARESPADRERIVGHLAICDECVVLLGEVMDERPVALSSTSPAASPELITRGYDAYRRTPSTVRPIGRWAPLAAAAAIVVAVTATIVWQRSGAPPIPSSNEIRGSDIQPLSPSGTVDQPLIFRWASPVAATTFLLEIADEGGRLVHAERVPREEAPASAALLARLKPGTRYTWTVVALDARGEPILRSSPQSFTLAR
jgi:hypothetical protein